MFRTILTISLCFRVLLIQSEEANTYTNPLPPPVADPFVQRHDGTYYLYGTTSASRGFRVFTSTNLIDWKAGGYVFWKTDKTWSQGNFWAPEMFEHNGTFYLHFGATSKTTGHRIVLCEGDSPAGPFREFKSPWFDDGLDVIDSHVFTDTDGRRYLYYVVDVTSTGIGEIRVRAVNDDLSVAKESTACIKPTQKWEGGKWNEGPFVLKHEGTYFLMYSANVATSREYSVGYATSQSPLGPWTKSADNPVLKATDKVSGPGHNSVIASPDQSELFIVYHVHRKPEGGWDRQLAIDRMRFEKDKAGIWHIRVTGPTSTTQPAPAAPSK